MSIQSNVIVGHFWAAKAGSDDAPPLLLLREATAGGRGGIPQPGNIIHLDPCEGCGVYEALARTIHGETVIGIGHPEGCTWMTETLADPNRDWYLAAPEEAGGTPAGPDSATLVSIHMHDQAPDARMFGAVHTNFAVEFLANISEVADVNTLPWEALPNVRSIVCGGMVNYRDVPNTVGPIGSTEDGQTWATWYVPVPQPPVPSA